MVNNTKIQENGTTLYSIMDYTLNVLVEMLITLSGFLLIFEGSERNRFYSAASNYIDDEGSHLTELLLATVSFPMMLIIVMQPIWLKILAISAFLYYDFLCYDILSNLRSFSGLLNFAQNYLIAWLAVETCFMASDQKAKDQIKKSKIETEEQYSDEGWYPLELPVEDNDMESSHHEVERIKQLVKLPTNQVIELESQIEDNIEKEETKIKNLSEKQLQIHFKLIMKVLELTNSATGASMMPQGLSEEKQPSQGEALCEKWTGQDESGRKTS